MLIKIVPQTSNALQCMVANLNRNNIKYVTIGSALVFDLAYDNPDVFEGCYAGYEANVEQQRVTDYDRFKYYNHQGSSEFLTG